MRSFLLVAVLRGRLPKTAISLALEMVLDYHILKKISILFISNIIKYSGLVKLRGLPCKRKWLFICKEFTESLNWFDCKLEKIQNEESEGEGRVRCHKQLFIIIMLCAIHFLSWRFSLVGTSISWFSMLTLIKESNCNIKFCKNTSLILTGWVLWLETEPTNCKFSIRALLHPLVIYLRRLLKRLLWKFIQNLV